MYDGWRYYHTVLQRARWDKPLYLGSLDTVDIKYKDADLCRGASRHHGARRLAQAARLEGAYGGHGVGVEQNDRPESSLVNTPHKQRGITRIDFGSGLV